MLVEQIIRLVRSPIVRVLFWLGVAVVTISSVMPLAQLPQTGVWDKGQHFLAYAALGGVGRLAYPDSRHIVVLLIGLILLGTGLEAAQGLVPGRFPSMGDVLANALGALAGFIVSQKILSLISKQD